MNSPETVPGAARVLVVDDEPDLRTLYELTLLREGHHVDAAGSLAEARERLASGAFDVVITDMRLPDGLGLEYADEFCHDHGDWSYFRFYTGIINRSL